MDGNNDERIRCSRILEYIATEFWFTGKNKNVNITWTLTTSAIAPSYYLFHFTCAAGLIHFTIHLLILILCKTFRAKTDFRYFR